MVVMGPGMGLRGDRILRYVDAFCPTCHRADPERPLADVRRLSARLVLSGQYSTGSRGEPGREVPET